jgi:hypothetical protein
MRFAYTDPPYVGQAKKHYKHDPKCAEVDHAVLVHDLIHGDYDGWALSCSSPSLRVLLPLCPAGVRVMAWVKPFAIFKPGVNPAYAWEPLLVHGGRPRVRDDETVRDWIAVNITLKRGLAGAKPFAFAWWLFEVFNMAPDDEFIDLYPGTGAVTEAWHKWQAHHTGCLRQIGLFHDPV